MRIVITAIVTALIAALAFSAKAESSSKKKQRDMASKKTQPHTSARNGTQQFGYDASPEHYPVGTREWWRAMEREGRGGFGETP